MTTRRAARLGLLLLWIPFAALAACPEGIDSQAIFAEAERLAAAGELQAAIECQRHGLNQQGPTLHAVEARLALASMYERSGDVTASVTELKTALSLQQQLSGANSEATGDLLRRLGWQEYITGSLQDAEAHLRRVQDIYQTVLDPRHIKVSKVLNSLGVVLRDKGQYEAAESMFATAFDIAAGGLTPDDDMRAVIYNNVAGLWYYRGDFRRAVENYHAALPIFERLYGAVNIDVAMTVNNLGSMYEELGDVEAARKYYRRALAIEEQILGDAHPTLGAPVNNLAVLEHSLGNTDAAESMFKRALNLFESSFGREHPKVAEVLVKYAALKHDLGQDDAALNLLQRALAIHQAAYGPDSNWTAATLSTLGPVYQALGLPERASDALVRAIGVAAAAGEPQMLLIAYDHYAEVLAANAEMPAAIFYGKFAVNLAQEIRHDVSALGKAVQKSFLAKRQHLYRNLADRLIARGRLAEAEQVMTMLKEEEFFDFVRVAMRTADGGATRADFSSLERPYADKLQTALQQLAANAEALRTSEEAQKNQRRTALIGEQQALHDMLDDASRVLARKTEQRVPTAPSIDAQIVPGAALVRYLVTDKRLRMIVATAAETRDLQVDVERERLNRLAFELREAVQSPSVDARPAAQALHELLIAPLQVILQHGEISSLELELDGALRYVPFSVLYDGERFLIERFAIQQRTIANAPQAVSTAAPRLAGFGVTRAVGGFPELPSVAAELDRIVLADKGDRSGVVPGIVVMDEAFTEARIRDVLARDYSLVHIASHFVFRPGPLSDSFLLLGSGKPLTLERLRDGNFSLQNVRLLTLSACSTAIGDSTDSGGELESFGVLAQRLGAREVLATLWPVADRSTSLLMLDLYRQSESAGLATAQALRHAQLALLRGQPRFAPYAHPFYWAPFILMSATDRK